MLLKTRVDRPGEGCDHQPTDAPLKLVIPSILFDSSCQIIVEEEAYDQTSLPLWGSTAVGEDGYGNLIGVQAAESPQPSIKPLSIQRIPIREQPSKIRSVKLTQPVS